MAILRQEPFFLFNRIKGKFIPCWSILSFHPTFGPSLCVYADGTTKKILLERITLAEIADGIRFGSTTWALADAEALHALISRGTEDFLDKELLITLPIKSNGPSDRKGRGRKAQAERHRSSIWMCALTVAQLFEFIQVLSDSLVSLQMVPPASNTCDSSVALHHYIPRPFQVANEWDIFWDNPPPFHQRQLQMEGAMERERTRTAKGVVDGGGSGTGDGKAKEDNGHGEGAKRPAKNRHAFQQMELAPRNNEEHVLTKSKELQEAERREEVTFKDEAVQTDQNDIGEKFFIGKQTVSTQL